MATARRTWQLSESRIARFFGAERMVLSGGSGRADAPTRSDSTHPQLYIEAKLKARDLARTLFDATKALAQAEGRVPILCIASKGRPGFLIVSHSSDFPEVVAEFAAANADVLEGPMRQAWLRLNGGDPLPTAVEEARD